MKRKKHKILAVLLMLSMLTLSACGDNKPPKEEEILQPDQHVTQKDDVTQQEEEVQNEMETIRVSEYKSFKEAIEAATGENQYFVLEDDINLSGGEGNFTGFEVTLDGGEQRVEIAMTANDAFHFKDADYPDDSIPLSRITMKNINFVNKKTIGNERTNTYAYAFADSVIYENCTFDGGVAVFANAKFINCTFTESNDLRYCLFIDNEYGTRTKGLSVELESCSFEGNNSAYGLVKVADDCRVGATLKVIDCSFSNVSNKAAVYVNGLTDVITAGENTYTNCTIGAILAKEYGCTLNGKAMVAGKSYEE